MDCLAEGYKIAIDELQGPTAKNAFSGRKPSFEAQKELLNGHHVLATTGKSWANKKVPFSQMNISLFADLGC